MSKAVLAMVETPHDITTLVDTCDNDTTQHELENHRASKWSE